MTRRIVCLSIVFALAASATAPAQTTAPSPSSVATPSVAAQLKPGTVIDAHNVEQFSKYIPAAAQFAISHGFRLQIIAQRRVGWSLGFQQATEKYSPQVKLDQDDHIENYVAGMPFPLVNADDPKAAVKIAYNWHMGPFMPDDFSLAPWSSNAYTADSADALKVTPDSDKGFGCEQFQFLRFAHRTDVDPRPTLGETDAEWKAKCNRWMMDQVGDFEGAGIWVRYLDAKRADEFFNFDERTRRIRRMGVNLAYPNESCRGCHQPYWAYALPKTENYSYRLLGTAAILACLGASDEPAGFKLSATGLTLGEEPFELRNVYILEMRPRYSKESDSAAPAVIYIDSEMYVWLAAEFYDARGLTATAIPLWRMRPSSEGGSLFDLAGSFYRTTAGGSLFRSLVPAHNEFNQVINSGTLSEGAFNPLMMPAMQ